MRVRLLVLLAVFAVFPSTALSAPSSCPSGGNPPPGSTVNGGLDVDGTCILDTVTVNGGITVEATGHLEIQNGTVNGGIVVLPCGELDINATTNGAGVPTGTSSTINGGIVITAGTLCPLVASLMPTSGRHRSTAGSPSRGRSPSLAPSFAATRSGAA